MINYPRLAWKLKGKSIGASYPKEVADKLMPWAYQFANPEGRPYHNDWAARGVPEAIQPWSKIRRMDTTFRIPLPFKLIEGNMKPRWMPWQEGYPEAPGADFRPVQEGTAAWDLKTRFDKPILREVFAYDPVGGVGDWGRFAGFIGGEWVECYYSSTSKFLGRRLHTNRIAKPDMTWGDMHVAFPDASLTWKELE